MCFKRGRKEGKQRPVDDKEAQALKGLAELVKAGRRGRTTTRSAVKKKQVWYQRAKALPDLDERHKRHRVDYDGIPISDPTRQGQSYKNQVIAHALFEAERHGYVLTTMARPGKACAYGGFKKVLVRKEHKLDFARLLFDTFQFPFDEKMFLDKDPQLGLDKQARERHVYSEIFLPQHWRTASHRGWQGLNYKEFQNSMGSTCKSTFGLKPLSDKRTSKWIDWMHGNICAAHAPR